MNLFLHTGRRLITFRQTSTHAILNPCVFKIWNLYMQIEPILKLPQDSLSSGFRFYFVIMFIQERINEESVIRAFN